MFGNRSELIEKIRNLQTEMTKALLLRDERIAKLEKAAAKVKTKAATAKKK